MKKAIYPGSFDPIHEGHVNIIEKASKLFDEVHVIISLNINKNNTLNSNERKELVLSKIKHLTNVFVDINESILTTEQAKKLNAKYLIRGLRSQDDFNYEVQYYDGIKALDDNLEIVYFISDEEKRTLSSSILKEIEHFKKRE
ncbi:phosphopantetheine adenylyltransferase [Entomoplasma ellychniae]|uniref:Phosphopantetheine adenylyltransferase n=2 Tax=Entomoplasmataceae TaxID=33925 RepID=A0A2S5RGJ9_9MOLU|nr:MULTISPECIES: pantetheine-phosphate adenylyltransferase [Entomoplasmataceae]PPE05004.1 phosphopantetheine adenylyltransferase [Entomoplasma ellychniae]PPE06464.1 phosphopantetheine adenylyltransferase [Mesoplasma corruscae]